MNHEELKQLWQISFDDSESYVNFYFSRRYRPENTRICLNDGHVVSAAQFFPYDISYDGTILKGVYILGVCTHPDYRRRGFTAQLIREILIEQAANGIEVAFLIPSKQYLFEIYRKFGFAELFVVYEENVKSASIGNYELMNPPSGEVFAFYNRFYRSLNSAVLKTYDDFIFAMEDTIISGGRVDICGINGEIRGFAATEGRVVKELLCLDAAARDTLLTALLLDVNGGGLTVMSPRLQPGVVKKIIGMARVLHPAAFLVKTRKKRDTIHISDSILTHNTGIYTIKSSGVEFDPNGRFDTALDISELPAYGMKESYANLLLN